VLLVAVQEASLGEERGGVGHPLTELLRGNVDHAVLSQWSADSLQLNTTRLCMLRVWLTVYPVDLHLAESCLTLSVLVLKHVSIFLVHAS
jgi:hypothetical protein